MTVTLNSSFNILGTIVPIIGVPFCFTLTSWFTILWPAVLRNHTMSCFNMKILSTYSECKDRLPLKELNI